MTRSDVIREARGNLLHADVDALVNTVNTVGVMGKGIALQFKRAYPAMFKAYASAAKSGELRLGSMHVWATGALTGPRFVINFPTKGHWKSPSRLPDVERGLDDLIRVIRELDIRSVAVPPLGCGNGGLDWTTVEPLIRAKLGVLEEVDVQLFPPAGAPPAAEMETAEPRRPMTSGRAALIGLLSAYAQRSLENASLIETQKLMYFLQEAGEPLRLEFVGHHYGPYADNLRKVIRDVEGQYLSGFGDGSLPVQSAEPLSLLPGADDAAADVLRDEPATRERIRRVLDLVEGFESSYALELLATVHWVLVRGGHSTTEDVIQAVRAWSPRKGRMFSEAHIETALEHLQGSGWEAPVSVG